MLADNYHMLDQEEQAEKIYMKALWLSKNYAIPDSDILSNTLSTVSHFYQSQNNDIKAIDYLEQAYQAAVKYSNPQSPAVAKQLIALGNHFYHRQNYDRAHNYYKAARHQYSMVHGIKHPSIANCLDKLGHIQFKLQNFQEADALYQQSLNLRQAIFGPVHQSISRSYQHLGNLNRLLGQYQKAETYYINSMAIIEAIFGTDNPRYISTQNFMIEQFLTQGKLSQAEELFNKKKNTLLTSDKLTQKEKAQIELDAINLLTHKFQYSKARQKLHMILTDLDPKDVTLQETISSAHEQLATIYLNQGLYNKSLFHLNQSLSIDKTSEQQPEKPSQSLLIALQTELENYKFVEPSITLKHQQLAKALGPENLEIIDIQNKLAQFHLKMGRSPTAHALYQHSLSIRKNHLPALHQDIANSYLNLSEVYLQEKAYEKALQSLHQASLIINKIYTQNNRYPLKIDKKRADVYWAQNNIEKARRLYEDTLTGYQRLYANHPDIMDIKSSLAAIYTKNHQHNKATILYQQALSEGKQMYGEDSPKLIQLLLDISLLNFEQKQFKEASIYLDKAKQNAYTSLPPTHSLQGQIAFTQGQLNEKSRDYKRALNNYHYSLNLYTAKLGQQHWKVLFMQKKIDDMMTKLDNKPK